jgi:predicted AAA+ superfamily ATPase
MMYPRTLQQTIHTISESFPVLMLTGPRQVGKTTLLEMCSGGARTYVTLDDMDPRCRLTPFHADCRLDRPRQGAGATTGSTATSERHYQKIWLGSFPRLVEQGERSRDLFYRSYIQTYLQRDVQDVLKVSDQLAFNRFLGTVAARTGQLLNYASLARDVEEDNKTVKSWLSILEISGLVYLLQPYHRNLTKRLVKTAKLYFLDTGLAAYLTKWPDSDSLEAGRMSGAMA